MENVKKKHIAWWAQLVVDDPNDFKIQLYIFLFNRAVIGYKLCQFHYLKLLHIFFSFLSF